MTIHLAIYWMAYTNRISFFWSERVHMVLNPQLWTGLGYNIQPTKKFPSLVPPYYSTHGVECILTVCVMLHGNFVYSNAIASFTLCRSVSSFGFITYIRVNNKTIELLYDRYATEVFCFLSKYLSQSLEWLDWGNCLTTTWVISSLAECCFDEGELWWFAKHRSIDCVWTLFFVSPIQG